MRRLMLVILTVLFAIPLVACGDNKTVVAPNVTGLALDDAHRQFEKLGVKKFSDKDYFESRSVLVDRNWAVVDQSPAAGSRVKTKVKVTLRVGKISESRTIDALPPTSPIKIAAAQRAADEATKQAAADAAAEQAHIKAVQTYVNALDPTVRLAENTLLEVDKLGSAIQAGAITGSEIAANVEGAQTALEQLTRY